MPTPSNTFVYCDVLENLPKQNKRNWLLELELLVDHLPQNASVLQVGSMDGTRILRLLERRPDLALTGLEIDEELVELAREHMQEQGWNVPMMHADITQDDLLRDLPSFDVVLCLNNTLGYISDEALAIENMRRLGKLVILSVYGEAFTDEVARAYFAALHLCIDRCEGNRFILADFARVKRYTRNDVGQWDGSIIETPLGYFCSLPGNPDL